MRQSDQFKTQLAALPPDIKKQIRRALRDMETGVRRDVKKLRAPLERFSRLRVGSWRVIFWHDGAEIILEYLGPRSSVYEDAEQALS